MNRKYFLSSVVLAGAVLSSFDGWAAPVRLEDAERGYRIPSYLKSGDVIGITSPAGFMTLEAVMPSVKLMESWGYRVKIGKTIGARDFTFGGTDEERTSDLQQMLDDPEVKAIMCARGGYGAVRIIDQIDFSYFKAHPKWIIGFSDITVLHCHIDRNFKIVSIHSKMCNSFPSDWATAEPIQIETILSIRQALAGESLKFVAPYSDGNRLGTAEGELVGGNLSIIESLSGSKSDLNTEGKILFVEDTGEYLYNIDRMFWNLKRNGKLSGLKGLIVGGFKIKPDDAGEEFGKTVKDIVLEKIKDYNYPVCFDFPVGHQRNNYALKCGAKHTLRVEQKESSLSCIV